MKTKCLVTGAAGFIGARLCEELLKDGHEVVGIDNFNHEYSTLMKVYRVGELTERYKEKFTFRKLSVDSQSSLKHIFNYAEFGAVFHLAGIAGVRGSIDKPHKYIEHNTVGTLNVLEAVRKFKVPILIFSSTSSIFTGQGFIPTTEGFPSVTPYSPYAGSKLGAEALCYAYHHNFGMNVTVLRYFSVYGEAGRPDMATFLFTEKVLRGKTIELYGGHQKRDFTYVGDVAKATKECLKLGGFNKLNIGAGKPYSMKELLSLVKKNTGIEPMVEMRPSSAVDAEGTWCDNSKARQLLGWKPEVSFEKGMERTVKWHKDNQNWLKAVVI